MTKIKPRFAMTSNYLICRGPHEAWMCLFKGWDIGVGETPFQAWLSFKSKNSHLLYPSMNPTYHR